MYSFVADAGVAAPAPIEEVALKFSLLRGAGVAFVATIEEAGGSAAERADGGSSGWALASS